VSLVPPPRGHSEIARVLILLLWLGEILGDRPRYVKCPEIFNPANKKLSYLIASMGFFAE
jgi:hypothetical protein